MYPPELVKPMQLELDLSMAKDDQVDNFIALIIYCNMHVDKFCYEM